MAIRIVYDGYYRGWVQKTYSTSGSDFTIKTYSTSGSDWTMSSTTPMWAKFYISTNNKVVT